MRLGHCQPAQGGLIPSVPATGESGPRWRNEGAWGRAIALSHGSHAPCGQRLAVREMTDSGRPREGNATQAATAGPEGARAGGLADQGVPRETEVAVGKAEPPGGAHVAPEGPRQPREPAEHQRPGERRAGTRGSRPRWPPRRPPRRPNHALAFLEGAGQLGSRGEETPASIRQGPRDIRRRCPVLPRGVPAWLCQGWRDAWGQSQASRDFRGKGTAENIRDL